MGNNAQDHNAQDGNAQDYDRKRRAARNMNMTIGELAEKLLAKHFDTETPFDTALPQTWRKDVHVTTGIDPYEAGTVWIYPAEHTFGVPFPLTIRARLAMLRYNHHKGTDYPLPSYVVNRMNGHIVCISGQRV